MIIHQIVIISLLVFAIHYTMLPGEIFGFIEKWWKKKEDRLLAQAERQLTAAQLNDSFSNEEDANPVFEKRAREAYKRADRLMKRHVVLEKISQPLFRCPVCMVPWHGTYLYWLIPWERMALPPHYWIDWLIVIIGALGMNSIIVRIFKDEE